MVDRNIHIYKNKKEKEKEKENQAKSSGFLGNQAYGEHMMRKTEKQWQRVLFQLATIALVLRSRLQSPEYHNGTIWAEALGLLSCLFLSTF